MQDPKALAAMLETALTMVEEDRGTIATLEDIVAQQAAEISRLREHILGLRSKGYPPGPLAASCLPRGQKICRHGTRQINGKFCVSRRWPTV